jgi:hypothetical protein
VIAALYVETNGVYYGLEDVDPWDEARDARLYAGPWPVVAHPPCARWSRLAGFTEARFGLKRGADGGCFGAALEAVRTFGGVLEHPAYSAAWDAFGLPEPLVVAGWTGGTCGGWSAYIEQGRYGLPVKKATWLYGCGVELPDLNWGYTPDNRGETPNGPFGGMDTWRDSWHPRAIGGRSGAWQRTVEGMRSNGERSRTPDAFRDVLLDMARSAHRVES